MSREIDLHLNAFHSFKLFTENGFVTIKVFCTDNNLDAAERGVTLHLDIPESMYGYLADLFRAAHEEAIRRHRTGFADSK
jgi:hypothetical protein